MIDEIMEKIHRNETVRSHGAKRFPAAHYLRIRSVIIFLSKEKIIYEQNRIS